MSGIPPDWRTHLHGLEDAWIEDEIPTRKADNARESHRLGSEPILWLFDGTLFGSASTSVVLTPERVSIKDDFERPRSVPWTELQPGDVVGTGSVVQVQGFEVRFPNWSEAHTDALAALCAQLPPVTRRWNPSRIVPMLREVLGHDACFFPPTLPDAKVANVREVHGLSDHEEIWALFDGTLFGSAKDGWVLTNRRLAVKGMWASPMMLPWSEVFAAERVLEGRALRIGAMVVDDGSFRLQALLDAVEALAELHGERHPREHGLEAAICDAPEDDGLRFVYADWLTERSCVYGLLANRQLAGADHDDLLRTHGLELGLHHDAWFQVSWRAGFWDRLALFGPVEPGRYADQDVYSITREVLRHPSARFLRMLQLGGFDTHRLPREQVEPVLEALAGADLPALRRLEVRAGPDAFVSSTLDLAQFPRLEECVLDVADVAPTVQSLMGRFVPK